MEHLESTCRVTATPGTTAATENFELGRLTIGTTPNLRGAEAALDLVVSLARVSSACDALWVHGSRAVGRADHHSDLDVAVIMKNAADVTSFHKTLQTGFERLTSFVGYYNEVREDLWRLEGKETGLHVLSNDEFKNRVSQAFQSLSTFEATQGFLQHVVLNSSPLIDRSGILSWAREEISSYPEAIREALIRKYLGRLAQKVTWWKIRNVWKGPFEELEDTSIIVKDIARVHYALNRRFFMQGLKHYPEDLSELLPQIKGDLHRIMPLSSSHAEQALKRRKIEDVVRQLGAAYRSQCNG